MMYDDVMVWIRAKYTAGHIHRATFCTVKHKLMDFAMLGMQAQQLLQVVVHRLAKSLIKSLKRPWAARVVSKKMQQSAIYKAKHVPP